MPLQKEGTTPSRQAPMHGDTITVEVANQVSRVEHRITMLGHAADADAVRGKVSSVPLARTRGSLPVKARRAMVELFQPKELSSVVLHRQAVTARHDEVSLLRVMPMVVVPHTREGEVDVGLLPRWYAGSVTDHTCNATVLNRRLSDAGFARAHTSSVIAPAHTSNGTHDAFNKCCCSYGPSIFFHDVCSYSYGPCLWKGYVHVVAGSLHYFAVKLRHTLQRASCAASLIYFVAKVRRTLD